jgi:hypothetical protein
MNLLSVNFEIHFITLTRTFRRTLPSSLRGLKNAQTHFASSNLKYSLSRS